MSIRLRLTLWHTGLLALLLAAFAGAVYWAVERQLTSQLEYTIHLQALETSRAVHQVGLGEPGSRTRRLPLAATTALADQRIYVQVLDTTGRPLVMSDNLAQPLAAPATSVQTALERGEAHATLTLGNQQIELLTTPLLLDDQLVGVLQVAAPLQPLHASLMQLRFVLIGVVLAAVALAAALGWFLVHQALRPVDHLTRAADTIGRSHDLSSRVTGPAGRDELGRLTATFNSMLDRLEQTAQTQRRFVADASHELRTPLAAMRTNVEALLRSAADNTLEREDTLRAVARETDRLGRLVGNLLALARADSGQPLECHRVALDGVLLEVYRQSRSMARDVHLIIGELHQVEVYGDGDRLKQVLLNLVDNAIRYTPRGGCITLELRHDRDAALLSVRDTGIGIATDQLPRIFERFYRVDRQRSRATGGTGLGLAICHTIVEAHGGSIDVKSTEGVGSTFTVKLPRTTSPSSRGLTASAENLSAGSLTRT